MGTHRELLAASTRARHVDEGNVNDDDVIKRPEPGKMTAAEARTLPPPSWAGVPAGKLTHADIDRKIMSPAVSLTFVDWMLSPERGWSPRTIDRRTEPGSEPVNDGALATALEFIVDSRAGQRLPQELAARLSAELDINASEIRVHTDDRAARAAAMLSARAFTIESDIYFAKDAYDPGSDNGIELIAHEAAHVAQNQRATTRSTRVSRPEDTHERQADEFAHRFTAPRRDQLRASDPADLIEHMRREGKRRDLPFMSDLEHHFGTSLDFVETFTGPAAELACELMGAGAFALRNIIALADATPTRDQVMHELTHVIQMGGRSARAPARFEHGSVTVGTRGSAVEEEASAHPASPTHTADPNTVHRDDKKKEIDKSTEAIADRIKGIATKTGGGLFSWEDFSKNKGNVRWGYKGGTRFDPRYYSASTPFTPSDYVSKKKDERDKGDLDTAVAGDTGKTHRLHKVDGKSQFIFSENGDYYATVTAVTAADMWVAQYKNAVETLKIKFTWPKESGTLKEDDPPLSKPKAEVDDYRRAMTTAIADKYKDSTGKFKKAYKDVIASDLFAGNPKLPANIFEEIAGLSASDGAQGVVSVSSGPGNIPRFDKVDFPAELAELAEKGVMGDGTMTVTIKGVTTHCLMECKGYIGDPDSKCAKQAAVYKTLLNKPGYKIGGAVQVQPLTHVAYFVTPPATPKAVREACLTKWRVMLENNLGVGNFSLIPPPAGYKYTVTLNPEFSFDVPENEKNVNIVNPEINHPGFKIRKLQATLDDTMKTTAGEVVYDVDAGDAFKKANNTKPLKQEGANIGGRIDNKLTGLTSKLSEQLPVEIDAAIVDGGVEATLKLKNGPTKGLAGFQIEGVELKAKYSSGGTLSVEGTIALKHQNGKINGTVTVGYAQGWTFEGKVTVSDGFIPGVPSFTAGVKKLGPGDWRVAIDEITIEKQFSAVKLSGTGRNLAYNTKTGHFSGDASVAADLGMFGTARGEAQIADNQLKRAVLSYDSPELKYPTRKQPPTLAGTIGGDVVFENGKFSGTVRGTANLNVPALKKIAGDGGLGLAVDATIGPDGEYHGTIKSTSPIKFGEHFEIPTIGCTIKPDGSVEGEFSIKIKKIKYLENAEIGCKIDKDGFKVTKADIHAAIGQPTDKLWGTIDVGYDETAGLKIGGTLNVKIKEGMVAKGTLTYNSKTNTIDVVLTVDEIKLFEVNKTKNLFKLSKQFPLVSFYNIIGIYLDLGLDLDFNFNMSLGLIPTITLDGLSFETWEYKKIAAELELTGQLRAALIATPKVGLGLFAVSPSLLRGGGGIKVPITGEALLKPTGKLKVGYSPSGAVEGDATIGMQLTFGIKGAVKPYAEAAVLDGAWNPSWTGDSLADFEILPPKELFSFTLDLAGDMSKKEPQIPTSPQPPKAPSAARQMPQEPAKTSEVGGGGPGKDAVPPTTSPAGGAPDDSVFKMASLTGALKGLPGYATISGFMEKAGKVWDKIKGFFGRVAKAFKSFFETIGDAIEEVLNGFASEGLGYLPKLIKKVVGDSTWSIIEPIVNAAASSAEAILGLFETDPPRNVGEMFTWSLKLMQRAFGVGFDSIGALISALHTMTTRLAGLANKIVTKMVQDGMIGVKRHQYYYWAFGTHYFLAATEYKINVLGTSIYFRESGMLTNPNDVVAAGLFTALETMGVPPTNMAVDDQTHETYRDRWV